MVTLTQVIVLLTSWVSNFYLSFTLGLDDFAEFQLFILYSSFSGIFHLGLIDGFYVRTQRRALSKSYRDTFNFQFCYLIGLLILLISLFILISVSFLDVDMKIWSFVLAFCFFSNLSDLFSVYWQLSGKISWFVRLNLIEKFITLFLMMLFVCFSWQNLELLFFFLVLPKIILIVIQLSVDDIVIWPTGITFDILFKIIKANHLVGLVVLGMNMLALAIFAFPKLIIEEYYGSIVFSEVSISMSLTTFVVAFATNIALLLYPGLISETKSKRFQKLFMTKRKLEWFFALLFLLTPVLLYFIEFWFGMSSKIIDYTFILLPLSFFQVKYYMVHVQLIKMQKFQSALLKINLLGIFILSFLVFVGISFNSVIIILLSLIFVVFVRSMILDYYLNRCQNISFKLDLFTNNLFPVAVSFLLGGLYFLI